MQKINIISCCAECSSFHRQKHKYFNFCEKAKRMLDHNSENVIDQTLISFPDWCPLESVRSLDGTRKNYRKEVKELAQILRKGGNSDSIDEASHYLNSLIAKEIANCEKGI